MRHLIRSLFLIIAVSFCNNEVGSAMLRSNDTDRQALLAFKDLITEDPLGLLSSWNNSLPLCEWRGITCGRKHQRVVVLDLRSQKLTGPISTSIGNLTFLRSIYLQDNGFQGNIPQELTLLIRLQHINFSTNALGGEIPSNLSNCPNLTILELSSNDLVGKIPVLLGSLRKLTSLILFSNNLVGGIPPSLGNLTLLQQLSLSDNSLHGNIPDSIGRLTNLEYFEIALNKLSGDVPPSIYNISSISHFYIVSNQLTGTLPSNIGLKLPNLRQISTGENLFRGPFPASFSNASEMRTLDISLSGLSGPIPIDLGRRMNDLRWLNLDSNNLGIGDDGDISFIDSLTNCTKLQALGLAGNGFGGVLPNSIGNLSIQINQLAVGSNQFVGTIPLGISNLVNLVVLGLEDNSLSGTIPFDIGKLSNMRFLTLRGNKLYGLIPSSIGNLTQLFELHLADNNLTGSIPSSVGNIQGIQKLNLSYNSFVGPIPNIVGLFSTLISMNLAHNSFIGPLPLEIGSMNNLEEFDVSENRLSGRIPSSLGNCLKLERLRLEGNLFQGGIFQSFSSLKGLVDLDLSRNNMSGKIPADLETLRFLNNLNLSINNFEGEVPSKGIFRNVSIVSLDGNAKLCGGVEELRLPDCPIRFKKKKNHLVLKIVIPAFSVVVCLAFASLLVVLYRKRRLRKQSSPNVYDADVLLRVSYDQLLKATEGFALTNLIGAGRFGTVYKGILHQVEKPVAVKVLNLEQLGASKSFIAECEALRNTRHRNLLKIITACASVNSVGNDFKALVFEFMSNGSLESWLYPREDELSPARNQNLIQRLNILIDVASALDYLHHQCETPIVHCDLKPSNVLLDEDMTAHVGDFGLAKLLEINHSGIVGGQTNSIAIKGSIGYIAPEYGMGGDVSTKGDVYSYGILLLEIITGRRPTDDTFKDGLSLHKFCKMALPERVMEIVDSRLLLQNSGEAIKSAKNQKVSNARMSECLVSLIRIGIACSTESPSERMDINNVITELKKNIKVLLGVGILGERRVRRQLAGEGTSHGTC